MRLIGQHYGGEVLGQLHRIVGSADVLGNPVGLFNTIGSGVKDVFYEPYQGFVSDRPQDFGIGLAKV
jgi:vacuolar protein sorting-associated protein 13A/C